MEVIYDKTKVKNNLKINLNKVQDIPRVLYKFEKNKLYTVLMVDKDPPSRKNPIYKWWVHWLIINNDLEILNYNPPNPPKNSGYHRY